MQIVLVEHDSVVVAYEPSGQYVGSGGTVDDWRQWVAESRPTWSEPTTALEPPTLIGKPPEHGEKCSLCGVRKRDSWEWRLNAIALGAFGHAAASEPPPCRLCNPLKEIQ